MTASTALVTITCGGGNDVGYIARLVLASLPRPVRRVPAIRRRIVAISEATDARFDGLGATFDRLLAGVRRRAPRATVVLVDYLTILPPDEDMATGPLPADVTAQRLAALTAAGMQAVADLLADRLENAPLNA